MPKRRRVRCFERLESRLVMADMGSIVSGIVYLDQNGNGLRESIGNLPAPSIQLAPRGPVVLQNSDDGSTGRLELGFGFDFYGNSYNQIYVNNNGNLTFTRSLSAYNPAGFPQSLPIIAPFWADVDTRAAGGGAVHVATGASPRGHMFIQVDWVDVGYYYKNVDKRNDFSLYIEDDPDGDICGFFYRSMQWTTGDANGDNGFGGTGAQIGFDSGNGANFLSFTRPSSANDLIFLNNTQYVFRVNPQGTPDTVALEPGVAGALVYVDINRNGTRDANEPYTQTQADDPSTPFVNEAGRYQLSELSAGEVVIRPELPPGFINTAPAGGAFNVTLTGSGQVLSGKDFGRFQLGIIGGAVVNDADADGQRDGHEVGSPGWTVFVDANGNAAYDPGERATLTDALGQFRLSSLTAGSYTVRVAPRVGWSSTNLPRDSQTVLVTSGLLETSHDFFRAPAGTISGRVYHDLNRDAVPAELESGLAGWTLFLDRDGDGIRDFSEPATVSDATGFYRFDELTSGAYVVRSAAQTGWIPTGPATGSYSITLTQPGQQVDDADFGQARPLPVRIVGLSPDPRSTVESGVNAIAVTFDQPIDAGTRWPGGFVLTGSGGDGRFDDGNERTVTVDSVDWNSESNTMTARLASFLARDAYRFSVRDLLIDVYGNRLDGEWTGRLPSGDRIAGGEFATTFTVTDAPPTADPVRVGTLQTQSLPIHLTGRDPDFDPLSFRVTRQPAHGTLTAGGSSADWIYRPNSTFTGHDEFQFVANDGRLDSAAARVDIDVAAAPCDLEPLALSVAAPGNLAMGQSIRLDWIGRNNGPGTTTTGYSSNWIDRIYLSTDALLGDGDLLVGARHSSSAAWTPGQTYAGLLDAVLPSDSERSGNLFLLLEVNADRGQQEVNRANNVLAQPIHLNPTIGLTGPFPGHFIDRQTPVTVSWHDMAAGVSGTIALAIDRDADPMNGIGHTLLRTGLAEDPDGDGDRAQVNLPALANGTYYLWARLSDGSRDYYSSPVPIQLVDEAHSDLVPAGEVVGGSSYDVLGVEIGRIGEELFYRVLTNFDATSRGGDIYVNIGGSFQRHNGRLAGIAVNDRVTRSGLPVHAGDLYVDATFDHGSVVSANPTFIRDYQQHVTGQSSATVRAVTGRAWRYEIDGSVSLAGLGATPDDPVQVEWAMYCGNDRGDQDNDKHLPDLVGDGFHIVRSEQDRPIRWGDTVTIEYVVANNAEEEATAGSSTAVFYLSADSRIAVDDRQLGSASVSSLAGGQRTTATVQIVLPSQPPDGYARKGDVYIGMIVDANNAVEEGDENNNSNLGLGHDLASLRLGGPPQLVNVITHGFNPTFWDMPGFQQPWLTTYKQALEDAAAGTDLANDMTTYPSTWDSSTGWIDAFAYTVGYIALQFAPPSWITEVLSELAEYMIEDSMDHAGRVAEEAAREIVSELKSTTDTLGRPEDGQWIHLIGHSRGAAVNARVSRLLASEGYTVDQYTALDGYSTDWPNIAKILGDISIVGEATASTKVNYRVQDSLAVVAAQWVESALHWVDQWLGIDRPLAGVTSDVIGQMGDWRAPDRSGYGFPNNDVVQGDAVDPRSNHVTITPIYFRSADRSSPEDYILNSRIGEARRRAESGQPALPVPVSLAAAAAATVPDDGTPRKYRQFRDGSFEGLGNLWRKVQQLPEQAGFEQVYLNDLVLSLRNTFRLLESTWDVTGQASLAREGDNTLVELSAGAATSLGQYLVLDTHGVDLQFDLNVATSGPGDRLLVLFGDRVLTSLDLANLPRTGQYTVSLAGLTSRAGRLEFRFGDNTGISTVVRLDNLVITGPPQIGSLVANFNPVGPTGALVLTANGVQDPRGGVVQVGFYRETNQVAGLQTGTGGDTLIGVDANGGNGWTVDLSAVARTAGALQFYAQVVDNDGLTSLEATTTVTVWNAAAPWQNPVRFLDVNLDGSVTPLDVLQVVNRLNQTGVGPLSAPTPGTTPPPFVDVSGDNFLSPQDVLIVINYVNSRPAGAAQVRAAMAPLPANEDQRGSGPTGGEADRVGWAHEEAGVGMSWPAWKPPLDERTVAIDTALLAAKALAAVAPSRSRQRSERTVPTDVAARLFAKIGSSPTSKFDLVDADLDDWLDPRRPVEHEWELLEDAIA